MQQIDNIDFDVSNAIDDLLVFYSNPITMQ